MTPEQEAAVNKLLAERDQVISDQADEIKDLKTKFDGLVRFVNKQVEDNERKVNAIDSVAFAAFAMHEEKANEFTLNTANVTETRERITKVLENFNTFREELQKEAEKRAKKEAKAAAKKAEVQAKRDAKKGRAPKKEEVKDEQPADDASN